jgi:hypothetical protein
MMECRRREEHRDQVLGLNHELREVLVYLWPPTMFPSIHRLMDVLDAVDGVVSKYARYDYLLLYRVACASLL